MTPNPLPAPSQTPAPKKSSVSLVFILLVAPLVVCCGIGTVSAIAIPNFIRFQARSKQMECKTNLKTLFTAEKTYRGENNTYTDDPRALGFSTIDTRYAYVIGRTVLKPTNVRVIKEGLLEQVPGTIRGSLGVQDDAFTIACVGSIDNDPAVDVWTLSSKDRVIDGQTVPAGVPHNDLSDLDN